MDGEKPAQEREEAAPVNVMNPWLQAQVATAGTSEHTPSPYRHPGLSAPWQHYHRHHPATMLPIEADLYASNCGDLFGLQGDFLTPATRELQIPDSALYCGQFTPPPQPPLSNVGWALPYGPEGDSMRQLSFSSEGDKMGYLPYGSEAEPQTLHPFQQVTSSRSGIRVKFMGPAEIGLNHRQRVSLRQQPLTMNPALPETTFSHLEDDVVEVEVVSTSASHCHSSERVSFNSIEEALASIESEPLENKDPPASLPPQPVRSQAMRAVHTETRPLRMADEKEEEVIKAAKSLFSKRTRTLYHWLYPDTSKTKLKATVSAAWDTLAEAEKQFYLSQVLGRFGLQASSLMINPQLDGIKGLPAAPIPAAASTMRPHHISEAQQAVDQLFASCEDSDTWTSFDINPPRSSPVPSPAPAPTPAPATAPGTARPPKSRALLGHTDRRKRTRSRLPQLGMLGSDQLDEEVNILKRMREAKLEAELEDDAELSSELEKFRLMAQESDRPVNCRDGDDFWRRTPDPEDIFTQLNF